MCLFLCGDPHSLYIQYIVCHVLDNYVLDVEEYYGVTRISLL